MPTNYHTLGQSAPVAATLTSLYTVPAATQAVASSIIIANRGTYTNIRIAVRPAGAAIANQHYIAYDVGLATNDTLIMTIGLTLAATDVVSVYAGHANTSFSLMGSEIT